MVMFGEDSIQPRIPHADPNDDQSIHLILSSELAEAVQHIRE